MSNSFQHKAQADQNNIVMSATAFSELSSATGMSVEEIRTWLSTLPTGSTIKVTHHYETPNQNQIVNNSNHSLSPPPPPRQLIVQHLDMLKQLPRAKRTEMEQNQDLAKLLPKVINQSIN